METSGFVKICLVVMAVASIAAISFTGTIPAALQLLPGQVAPVRLTASKDFEYESSLQRTREEAATRARVAPVYRRDMTVFEEFSAAFNSFFQAMEEASPDRYQEIAARFSETGTFQASVEDVRSFLSLKADGRLEAARLAGLRVLGDLFRTGIYDDTLRRADEAGLTLLLLADGVDARTVGVRTIPLRLAAATLRSNLEGENLPQEVIDALVRVLRTAIRPNLVFDAEATGRRADLAAAAVGPVVVSVTAGQTLVEAGQKVTPDVHELLSAYRSELAESGTDLPALDDRFLGRVLQVFAMLLAAAVYLRLHDPRTLESNSRLALIILVVISNLLLVRSTLALGKLPYLLENPGLAAALPYLAPVVLAPLFLTILLGSGPGVFTALIVSVFSGVIHSGRLDVMVMSFLASLVAVYGCQAIRLRAHVVRAAALAGAAVAILALLIGLADRTPLEVFSLQMLVGFMVCTICGFLVIGMLPVFESVFGRTTDITFLELTDFNHPLLRRLQLEAPGTYHHSLVVANLAENAATAIGANGLMARVCALFHDIGKMIKPEYFTENQRGSQNPHDLRNPSMSALIIKSHVKEGVALAQEYRLPQPVIDTIRQHHGTTLMQFFFTRAKERLKGGKSAGALAEFPPEQVPEGVYRYDGPKPRFKESAIIHLADSCEAASRSLRKVTSQSLAEMIDDIVEARVADGQLDECPLTLEELSKIKGSFTFTLLNMLHGRVAYAPAAGAEPAAPAPGVIPIQPQANAKPSEDKLHG
jgi:putative nucleotidyltransferase with HDIG domain